MSLYPPPIEIKSEVFARVPERFRKRVRSAWADGNKGGDILDSFLEGPSFDRAGNLYVTDIPHGRVFRVGPKGGDDWTLITEYDGWPNGLKIHKDGRIFITDYKRGIMLLDPASGKVTPYIETSWSESFKGVNDLIFASNGDLYFTDQGQTGLHDPTGRVWRLRASDGRLEKLINTIPSPNGIVLSANERIVYVGVTRANAVWRLPLMPDGSLSKVGLWVQLSGGYAGPDGMAPDEEGGVAITHAGNGRVWLVDHLGHPKHVVISAAGLSVTNCAYGGADRKTLIMTESETGTLLMARVPVAGRALYSHH